MKHIPPPRVIDRWRESLWVTAGGCHVSTYCTASNGYIAIGWVDGGVNHTQTAHRIAWYATHGPIPADLTVDHLCRNKRCSNVEHLRLLSNEENGQLNGHAMKTHCPQGHPYDEQNTRFKVIKKTGRLGRECRKCRNARATDWKRRRRLEMQAA